MKQLLVLSGKGGTGKTTMVASFIDLSQARAYADCDVDAPNLHLVMNETAEPETKDYVGMDKAVIDPEKCMECGKCFDSCRFGAISHDEKAGTFLVDKYACEGCSVCQAVCLADAVEMKSFKDGDMYLYKGEHTFSTAKLKMGSGTSGKLVTGVKKNLSDNIDKTKEKIGILDGSPGIGCPVIASVSGVDMMLIVAEPTLSGMSDMKRVAEVGKHFKIPVAVCVNKYDVNEEIAGEIKQYSLENDMNFVGLIPFDKGITKITNSGSTPIRVQTKSSEPIKEVYKNTIKILEKELL